MSSPLEDLLQKAETASMPPPPPSSGIPKQKLPHVFRILILLTLLPFIYLEKIADTIAKWIIRPPFIQEGKCKRRGNCCHYILFPETEGVMKKLFFFWSTEIHGFYPRNELVYEYEGKKVYAMGCRYLRKNGSCGNYFLRPRVCRNWPIIRHFGRPHILKGCGYQAKLRPSYAKKHPSLRVLED